MNGATQYDLQVSTDGTFLDPNQMVVDRTGSNRLGNQIAFQSRRPAVPGHRLLLAGPRRERDLPWAATRPRRPSRRPPPRRRPDGPPGQALAALEATGNLEVVTGYDYASGLWQSYVPGLPGNSLATIQPNSVLFITVMEDTTVIVSGVVVQYQPPTLRPPYQLGRRLRSSSNRTDAIGTDPRNGGAPR